MAASVVDHLDVLDTDIYTVGWICAVHREYVAATELLDEEYGRPRVNLENDNNTYTLGRLYGHYVVIAVLPNGEYGTTTAASVARDMLHSFPNVRVGLMVGIGGGAPSKKHDIRLGDIVVGVAHAGPSVVQYDYGKTVQSREFQTTGYLNQSPPILRSAVNQLIGLYDRHSCQIEKEVNTVLNSNPRLNNYQRPNSSNDRLYRSEVVHPYGIEGDCTILCGGDASRLVERQRRSQAEGNTRIHYGLIASANQLMKDATVRDELAATQEVLCFEMEAAGLMNHFPCLVIRGICDYSDSHKNKDWQGYAAFVAAAYAKDLLGQIAPKQVKAQRRIIVTDSDVLDTSRGSGRFDIANFLKHPVTVFGFVVLLVVLGLWRGAQNINTGQQVNSGIMSGKQTFNYGPRPQIDFSFIKPLGLCLDRAPYIDDSLFIGRAAEIKHMHQLLNTGDHANGQQQRLVLGGVGGIGKTQLAITFAKQERTNYDTILWMDASSEVMLRISFELVLGRILDIRDLEDLSSGQIVNGVKQWLSEKSNTRWLLIFDNYDEPTMYRLNAYYPQAFHGTIIITTRLPSHIEGSRLDVKALHDIQHGLQILQTRSRRDNVTSDVFARRLANRLEGLPLALATAGAYLKHSTLTFEQYLQEYEALWNINLQRPLGLPDYQNRTLFTTWDLSYRQLEGEDQRAANILKLLAYFGPQFISFDLFDGKQHRNIPPWLREATTDFITFDSVMHILADCCFIEVQSSLQTYSMHACVHDWTLSALNQQIELRSYWYAFESVAKSIGNLDKKDFAHQRFTRVLPHAVGLTHNKFHQALEELDEERVQDMEGLALLLSGQFQLDSAEFMLDRVLQWREKTLGSEHRSTLATINEFGILYKRQDKLDQAEQMYLRALQGYSQAFGPTYESTLGVAHNLGDLYYQQGRLDQAEQMYLRVFTEYKDKPYLHSHLLVSTGHNLGQLYAEQGKLDQAEDMYLKAISGYTAFLGLDHTKTLGTISDLGLLYGKQNKLDLAEQMLARAIAGYERTLEANHKWTLGAVHNLALVYVKQDNLDLAEQTCLRALAGYEQTLGPDHTSTLQTVNNLASLYIKQDKLDLAEQMYSRVIAGCEKTLGPNHYETVLAIYNLGSLYAKNGKPDQANKLYLRALTRLQLEGKVNKQVADALIQ